MTVGELRKELEGVPDGVDIVVYADTELLRKGFASQVLAAEADEELRWSSNPPTPTLAGVFHL